MNISNIFSYTHSKSHTNTEISHDIREPAIELTDSEMLHQFSIKTPLTGELMSDNDVNKNTHILSIELNPQIIVDVLPIHTNIQIKLDNFLKLNKVPHIIFHGSSGTGKRTIVYNFLNKIYHYDKNKLKSNVMFVNCSHFKGIKFIRDELKFFAKINIQSNSGVSFKTIVLLNADYLTIDAQSALRRCIELYSYNTRFFIIVENKHKLLNPILSRFCEIYIPDYLHNNRVLNLYQFNLSKKYDFTEYKKSKQTRISEIIEKHQLLTPSVKKDGTSQSRELIRISTEIYENGLSAIDFMKYVENSNKWTEVECIHLEMCFYKIKSEFRFEKLLLFYMLNMAFSIQC